MSGTTLPQNFSRYPMLWLSVWLSAGVVLGHFFEIGFAVPLVASVFLAACCIAFDKTSLFLIPLVFISLGVMCHEIECANTPANRIKRVYAEGWIQSGEPVEIEGVLYGLPEFAYDGEFLLVDADRLTFKNSIAKVSGKVRLFLPMHDGSGSAPDTEQLDLRYGSRLRIYCELEREETFQNPGVASRVEMLDQRGIDATATIKSRLLVEELGEESVFEPLAWIYEQRQRLILEFREHFSAPTAGVMIASLLGNQHFLDHRTSEVFREGGTFHVLVISGLHITFIGGLTLWLVSYLFRNRSLQFILAAVFLWAYTFAVGAEVPVVRASIMFSVLLFSKVVHRRGSQMNALGLCVLILLVWRPGDLFSASFQLTIVSVAAIVGCSFPLIEKFRAIGQWMPGAEEPLPPRASKRLKRFCEFLYWNDAIWKIESSRQIWSANLFKSAFPRWLRAPNLQNLLAHVFEGLLVSIIVQVWMLPLLVIYFHRISPVSVLLNLWVGLFLALESFCALFAVLIGAANACLAAPLIALTELLNGFMMWLPGWFSANQLASFRVPIYPGLGKGIYFLFGLAVLIGAAGIFRWNPFNANPPSPRFRTAITTAGLAAAAALGLVITFHPLSAPAAAGLLKIDFLDVGQGDSALVTFPDGTTMLVDGGGQMNFRGSDDDFEPDRRRIGEAVVSEFLWEKGYSSIDYIVATHADADHIQGLADVARNFSIGSILVGAVAEDDPEFTELMEVAESRRITVSGVHLGDHLSIGGATVQIFNPENNLPPSGSANNASVVMKIAFGTRSFLLTGDIEQATERTLLANPVSDLRTDVIKVAHHGSRTSSTESLVDRVAAETAVISVGRKSRFGHPHPEVVARWRESGAQIFKTGDKGTVTIETDGNGIQVRTFIP
ncbi:MAG: ComEC/Rec2 family competence protein [Pyrinomonadaceae bacterium]